MPPRTFVLHGTHYCFSCVRPFPDGDPQEEADVRLLTELCAVSDDETAARGFFALREYIAWREQRAQMWAPRLSLHLADGDFIFTADSAFFLLSKQRPFTAEQLSGLLDTQVMPALREVLMDTLLPSSSSSPASSSAALEFEASPTCIDFLLRANPNLSTADMYPYGFVRLPNGEVRDRAAC